MFIVNFCQLFLIFSFVAVIIALIVPVAVIVVVVAVAVAANTAVTTAGADTAIAAVLQKDSILAATLHYFFRF